MLDCLADFKYQELGEHDPSFDVRRQRSIRRTNDPKRDISCVEWKRLKPNTCDGFMVPVAPSMV